MVAGKLVLISLLFWEVLLVHAMAGGSEAKPPEIKVHKEDDDEPGWVVPREADEPDESPEDVEAEAPEIRRLGKHHILSSTKSGCRWCHHCWTCHCCFCSCCCLHSSYKNKG
ncbi:hypothetical protein ERO13_D04G146551v2 [Gossypium hirsutum]|nr:hypothetical protein ERO13_D04G146551v2 [Gossypium hirsutum]